MKKIDDNFVVLDFETSGLDYITDRIIEIGAILHNKSGTKEMSCLVNQCIPITEASIKIHGISERDLLTKGRQADEAFKELMDFIGSRPIIAHNGLKFDYVFLVNQLTRLGIAIPDNQILDSCVISRQVIPEVRSFSLADLCLHFDITNTDPHRAIGDCYATLAIWHKLEKMDYSNQAYDQDLPQRLSDYIKIPHHLYGLKQAIRTQSDIEIKYQMKDVQVTIRIKPKRIILGPAGRLYCFAICLKTAMEKQYRLDRIKQIE